MFIVVTDKRLLDSTGGIVQGMSGSPVLQNGKLIGAVTHVLVNDPKKGYAIFIENMLAEHEIRKNTKSCIKYVEWWRTNFPDISKFSLVITGNIC